MRDIKTSLIITTYNWKEALKIVLLSVFDQTVLPDEIIIADDGSKEDTRDMIEEIAQQSPVKILHSWQEDIGFRAAKSRNKAIALSKSEYIILIDGDCILHKKFIEDHIRHRRLNTFTIGPRVLLPPIVDLENMMIKNLFFKPSLKNRKNCIHSSLLSRLSYRINSLRAIRSCNMGIWRENILKINGFNEDFEGWGREDSEFAARLLNSGCIRKNIVFNAICYHIFHSENDRSRLIANDQLLSDSIQNKLTSCQNGISNYL